MHSTSAGLIEEQDGSRIRSRNWGTLEAKALSGCDGCHYTLVAASTLLSSLLQQGQLPMYSDL